MLMYAWTALVVFGGIATIYAFLTSGPSSAAELVLGTLFLLAFFSVIGATVWAIYLAYQLSVGLRNGRLIVRSWLKIGPLGTAREIDIAHATSALILRPYFVEFEIPGATTRVWSMYQTVHDRDRFGTMWWFDTDYEEFSAMLQDLGIESEYRHASGIGWLASWLASK